MKKSNCLEKWRSGKPVLGITLLLTDPAIFELVSILGFDLIWVDMEHHAHSLETVGKLMCAARTGNSDVVVRPAKGEFMKAARLLEAGANGIMYPRCDSESEAVQLVNTTKFPPIGSRGLDGSGVDAGYGTVPLKQYIAGANHETFLIVQVESNEGLKNSEEIAKVQGVDMIFFGPGDFSLQNGFEGNFQDPRYWEAIETVARSADTAGKMWGSPAFSPEHAMQLLDKGAKLVTYTSDLTLLRKRFGDIRNEFGDLGFCFDGIM